MTSDAELCIRIRTSDKLAADSIQARHEGLIFTVIRRHGYYSTPEYIQAGRIGLHAAAISFYPDRGPFASWACRLIQQEIIHEWYTQKKIRGTGGVVINGGYRASILKPIRRDAKVLDTVPETAKEWTNKARRRRKGKSLNQPDLESVKKSLESLSPLPRVVCLLLLQGLNPVKRLGLYPGELAAIRKRAYAEMG